jgi:hypothetical protein
MVDFKFAMNWKNKFDGRVKRSMDKVLELEQQRNQEFATLGNLEYNIKVLTSQAVQSAQKISNLNQEIAKAKEYSQSIPQSVAPAQNASPLNEVPSPPVVEEVQQSV